MIWQRDGNGSVTTWGYNAQGLLAWQLDPLGRRIDYGYDAAGQLTTETWTNPDGSVADTYSYSYNAAGQLLTASNSAGTYTYTYNAAGLVATQTDPFGLTLTYGYDAAGNVNSVADSLGGVTTSAYNASNQLTSRSYSGPEVSAPVTIGLTYNATGQLATLTDSRDLTGANPSATTNYQYDSTGNTTQIVSQDGSGNVLASYQYTYGPSSATTSGGTGQSTTLSPTAVSDLLFSETDNGVTTNYGYDAQDQLTSAGSTTETYDADGNRTGAGYVYGPDNELLSDGTWNYTYDAVGNLVQKVNIATGETWTYGYDFNNRMTWAVDRQANGALIQQATYRYDAFGNLVEEDVPAAAGTTTATRYAYDRGNAWAALDGNDDNALETRYFYLSGPDQPAAQISANGEVGWYLTDRLGSVCQVVNDAGQVLDQIAYDAFGNVTSETNPSQAPRFGFQGMVRDAATGLDDTHGRDYDPATGRWTTLDPSGLTAGDANEYRFVGNDPTNAIDPSGLDPWWFTSFGEAWNAAGMIWNAPGEWSKANKLDEQIQANRKKDLDRLDSDPQALLRRIDNPNVDSSEQSMTNAGLDPNRKENFRNGLGQAGILANIAVIWATLGPSFVTASGETLALRGGQWVKAGTGAPATAAEESAADAAIAATQRGLDPNKLNHIFGNPAHNLGALVTAFRTEATAFQAIQQATDAVVAAKGITGVFQETVTVGGQAITVSGKVIGGVVKIGTAFK